MSILQVVKLMPSPTFCDVGVESAPAPMSSVGAIAGWQDELAFAALRRAYAASGGISQGDDLERMLADHGRGPFISLAKLLENEEIFGFEWNRSLWIPMFQFGAGDLLIRAQPRRIRAELGKEFDGWAASTWFVEPNVWLAGHRPIDLMESRIGAVMHAARADRFVAAG